MNLFQCDEAELSAIPDPTAISTPLGVVRLKARLSGSAVDEEATTATYRVPGNGRLIVWEREDLDAELLICHPEFAEPLFWPVKETWGALWRVRAKALTGPILFWAEWDDGYCWTESDLNGGQFLYAKVWEDGQTEVTLGTKDDEMLTLRARKNDYLPTEWEHYFQDPKDPRYRTILPYDPYWMGHPIHNYLSRTGVPSPLLPLKEGQEIQIQFAVAWADADELSSCATATAVEASPSEILMGGRCT